MKNSNPIIRAIDNSRATPEEKLEAWKRLALDDDVLDQSKAKPEKAPLIPLVDTVEQAEKLMVSGDEIVGLSTGYKAIDLMTKGIGPSEIVVIFGDTSHGKSQLAQNISINVARQDGPVLFVGLEMSNIENTARFMTMAEKDAEQLPIFYPGNMDLGYKDIDNLVGSAKEAGTVLVVIDHLHMFARDVTNLANELSLICHEFKRVARKYELPMLVISHISRSGSGRPPELKDLKGSSSIEQDADIALAVWRDMDKEDNVLKVVLRKNRLRGRQQRTAELAILPNARLAEKLTISAFPSR